MEYKAYLKRKLVEILILNWKPKLICLVLAVAIWTWVETFYVQSSTNKEWNLDRIRISLPE